MKRFIWALAVLLLFTCTLITPEVEACTGMFAQAEDGSVVYARTLEFAAEMDSKVIAIPKGYKYTGVTPAGEGGAEWEVKYNIIGMNFFNNDLLTDGLNDQGLQGGDFYFPGYAKFEDYSPKYAGKAIAPEQFVAWVLSNFKNVKEIEEHFRDVVLVNTVNKDLKIVLPLHFLFVDKNGDSLVIEYSDKGVATYKNPVGAFTNSPSFDWHLTNLCTYVKLTPEDIQGRKLGALELNSFGDGSGMVGLPGDATPPSRFIRVAYTLDAVKPFATGAEGMNKLMRLLKDFYLVEGMVRCSMDDGKVRSDHTEYEVYKNLNEFAFYVDVYSDINLKKVDGSKIDFSKGVLQIIDLGKGEEFEDITGQIKDKE